MPPTTRLCGRSAPALVIAALVTGAIASVSAVGEPNPTDPATANAIAGANGLSDAFKHAARTVAPSVVHITALQPAAPVAGLGGAAPHGLPFDDEMFKRFFEERLPDGFRMRPNANHDDVVPRGQGTGFVVRADGHIVTNNHVVADAEAIRVRLADGREYDATVVGTDAGTDLAVIRIEADDLRPVALGRSAALSAGEWVIAVGSPFGLEQTVTAGIVSATGRHDMGLARFENFIQTDAAINPGNSGGPLVNLHGEVVGVNTAITSRSGGHNGIGFAIPSDMVRTVTDSIIDNGRIARGWLGVSIQPLTPELAESFGLESADGVLIADVLADGPSADAGVEPGDVVTAIGDRAIASRGELLHAIGTSAPGTELTLHVVRDGSERAIDVTLGERPADEATTGGPVSGARPASALGLTVEPAEDGSGVVVTAVTQDGRAARAGLRPGDVILRVGRSEVPDPEAFRAAVAGAKADASLRLLIQRGSARQFLMVPAAE
jgi:serine protease Do